MAGRPRSLDDAKRQTILNAISEGLGRNTAAAIAETSRPTIEREAQRNPQFRAQLKKAEASCEQVAIRRIRNAKEWQASAWFLERKWPSKWGRRTTSDVNFRELPADKLINADPDESC